MDGKTAPITRAADLAVKKGIVVITAAGNEGNSSWRYIIAPADGDSVIAVGAVQSNGLIAGFSSRGPSFDGRIKPDIVAMGVGVSCVAIPPATGTGTAYSAADGTSLATPLAAGVAALVLSAHPELTPMQVREAMIKTADKAKTPDNTYGYGLIDAMAAITYWGSPEALPEQFKLVGTYPNPFSANKSELHIVADLATEAAVQIEIYNLLGQKVTTVWSGIRGAGNKRQWQWDGRDAFGNRLSSGVYFLQFRAGAYRTVTRITLLN
jgi:serine protease AprX